MKEIKIKLSDEQYKIVEKIAFARDEKIEDTADLIFKHGVTAFLETPLSEMSCTTFYISEEFEKVPVNA